MATKENLKTWIVEALYELGGSGSVVEVAAVVWRRHEPDLRVAGDLFYTWQYDLRWAAQELRDAGELRAADGRRSPWKLP